jgi:rfaE bifunctional protein kinase chain/domain
MINSADIDNIRAMAGGMRAVVIGDAMLDRYIHGTVDRISPEAPVPVVNHLYTETKAGGAANVALNLAAWGCRTQLIGLAGQDEGGTQLRALMADAGILDGLHLLPGRPTTVKTRIVAAAHHLLRIDDESTAYLDGEQESDAVRATIEKLEDFRPHLIILEDYNKGWLSQGMIYAVITWGKAHDCFIAVDPKEKHFFDYRHVDLFKPNLREASQAARTHLQPGDLRQLCREWRDKMNAKWIAVTLGSQGIYLSGPEEQAQVRPSRAIDVVDVCGAGDAVVAALALGLMAGLGGQEAGQLANTAGAFVCAHSGVVAVDPAGLAGWLGPK